MLSVLPVINIIPQQNNATNNSDIQMAVGNGNRDMGFGGILEVAMQDNLVTSEMPPKENVFTQALELLKSSEIITPSNNEIDNTKVFTDEMGMAAASGALPTPIMDMAKVELQTQVEHTAIVDNSNKIYEIISSSFKNGYLPESEISLSRNINGKPLDQAVVYTGIHNAQLINQDLTKPVVLEESVQEQIPENNIEFEGTIDTKNFGKDYKVINQVGKIELKSITKAEDLAGVEIDNEFEIGEDEINPQNTQVRYEHEVVNEKDNDSEVILNSKSSLEVELSLDKINSSKSPEHIEEIAKTVKTTEISSSNDISLANLSARKVQEIKENNNTQNQQYNQSDRKDSADNNHKTIETENNVSHVSVMHSKNAMAALEHAEITTKELAIPVTEQIKSHIYRNIQTGVRQMTVQLEPVELGKVEISVSIDRDSTVKQIFVNIEKRETFEMLQRDLANLEKNLNDTGIKLTTGDINLSLMSDRSFSDHQREFMEEQREFLQSLSHDFMADDDTEKAKEQIYKLDRVLDIVA